MIQQVEESTGKYKVDTDRDLAVPEPDWKEEMKEVVFKAGQSRRIWNELYKVQYTLVT